MQRFPPPSPPYHGSADDFTPFGVGYVELPGEVIVETRLTESDPARLRIGMPMRLTGIEVTTATGEQALAFAFAPVEEGERNVKNSVAIIGIGCRPFGRYQDTSVRQEAVLAARLALADAGVSWTDIQYAVGGSMDGGSADTLVADLGLTGVPFVNVLNGCATGSSSLISAVHTIASGAADLALVIGFDSHPRGAFAINPSALGLGQLVRGSRSGAHLPVLRAQDPTLSARTRPSGATADQGRGQGIPQRIAEPAGVAAQTAVRGRYRRAR